MQEAMGYIYKITNKVNGKVYIGKTINSIEHRWKQHIEKSKKLDYPFYKAIRKYGPDNFSLEQIEEVSLDILNEREIYWIDFYNSYYEGYNATFGGDGDVKYNYSEIANYQSQVQSLSKTMKKFGCSPQTVEKACRSCNIPSPMESYVDKVKTPVVMMNEQGECLQNFNTLCEAGKYIASQGFSKNKRSAINAIFRAINYKKRNNNRTTNYACNYYWCYQKDYYDGYKNEILNSQNHPRAVVQLSKDEVFIAVFPSIAEASRATGIGQCNIGNVCHKYHQRKIAGGYKWMFLEEYEELVEENEINLTTNEK